MLLMPPPLTPPSPTSSPWSHRALRALFGVWLVGFVVIGAYLLAPHLLTLPVPEADDVQLQRSVAQRLPSQQGRWLVLHVLDEDCPCSLRVLDHLLGAPRPAGVAERVVWIAGAHDPPRAAAIAAIRAHGFDLDVVTPDQLDARYHIQAAPILVVIDPTNTVRYVGGYTPRKQADDVRDGAIIAAVQRGERVKPLPTFGCAVGAALRTTIDPLKIRRWN
jgi:hypothetical protein